MDFNAISPRRTTSLRPQPSQEPVAGLFLELSRIFEDALAAIGRAPWTTSPLPTLRMAKMEASETDKEISIVTELPGVSAQDVDVSLDGEVLTIRAEIKAESATEPTGERDYHVIERDYGRVLRSFRLPFSPDPKHVDAILQDGLLTIRVAKPQSVQDKVLKIPVRASDSTQDARSRPVGGGATEGARPAGQMKIASTSEKETAPH